MLVNEKYKKRVLFESILNNKDKDKNNVDEDERGSKNISKSIINFKSNVELYKEEEKYKKLSESLEVKGNRINVDSYKKHDLNKRKDEIERKVEKTVEDYKKYKESVNNKETLEMINQKEIFKSAVKEKYKTRKIEENSNKTNIERENIRKIYDEKKGIYEKINLFLSEEYNSLSKLGFEERNLKLFEIYNNILKPKGRERFNGEIIDIYIQCLYEDINSEIDFLIKEYRLNNSRLNENQKDLFNKIIPVFEGIDKYDKSSDVYSIILKKVNFLKEGIMKN